MYYVCVKEGNNPKNTVVEHCCSGLLIPPEFKQDLSSADHSDCWEIKNNILIEQISHSIKSMPSRWRLSKYGMKYCTSIPNAIQRKEFVTYVQCRAKPYFKKWELQIIHKSKIMRKSVLNVICTCSIFQQNQTTLNRIEYMHLTVVAIFCRALLSSPTCSSCDVSGI